MTEVIGQRARSPIALPVLGAVSACHLLNDTLQSLLASLYPLFKGSFDLSFSQVGILALTYQATGSMLQPLVGGFTDRRPQPYSLPAGMAASLAGILILAFAQTYAMLLVGSALLGIGSSIFHPESSRIARLASGGAYGFAQSVFQVGGNIGSALGPLLAAYFVLPRGQSALAWLALMALTGMTALTALGHWYKNNGMAPARVQFPAGYVPPVAAADVRRAMTVLIALLFSKYVYMASFTGYFIFYLMRRFAVTETNAQLFLFGFLAATAAGTVVGGAVTDRVGRKRVIWVSILGVAPFTLLLPYVGLTATAVLSVVIAFVSASAFAAIVVYGQELLPNRVGMVAGLFFGLAFGFAGIGAAGLGYLADRTSIEFVYQACGFLPLLGLLAAFLPNLDSMRLRHVAA